MAGRYLDVRTALTQVQVALVETIRLGLGWRRPPVANLAALEAASVGQVADREILLVQGEGVIYQWSVTSTLAPIWPSVVQPAERATNGKPGRWLRTFSEETLGPAYFRPLHRVPTGYAKTVQLYEGQRGEELERSLGRKPAFLVEWVGDHLVSKGRNGEIYEVDYDFVIHCISQCLRPPPDAVQGSPIAADAGDPGLNRMIGDLRYLLAGNRLGIRPGVKFCDIQGRGEVEVSDLAERAFLGTVGITVKASWNIPDEDLIQNGEIWIQTQMADTPDGEYFDVNNFVEAGYIVEENGGLTGTPAAGRARVGGEVVATAPAPHLFPASRDTYRDLRPDGALLYADVAIDADPPDQEPGTLRIGVTRTDNTSIIADTLLCHFAINSGDRFRVPKPT